MDRWDMLSAQTASSGARISIGSLMMLQHTGQHPRLAVRDDDSVAEAMVLDIGAERPKFRSPEVLVHSRLLDGPARAALLHTERATQCDVRGTC